MKSDTNIKRYNTSTIQFLAPPPDSLRKHRTFLKYMEREIISRTILRYNSIEDDVLYETDK
jgi:hypothetical protein